MIERPIIDDAGVRRMATIALAKRIGNGRKDERNQFRLPDSLRYAVPEERHVALESRSHMSCVDNDQVDVARHVLTFFGIDAILSQAGSSAETQRPLAVT